MKTTFRVIMAFLLSAVLSILLCIPAFALIEPSESFYVTDNASVLSEKTENNIISVNQLLNQATGGEIAVVTVRYLESGYYADEYAVELFNSWGVGSEKYDNGMLLLLVTEEGKAWLTQGYGIKDSFTDEDISKLLDKHFWKKFDKADYDGAVSELFEELIGWYEDNYNVNLQNADANTASGEASGSTAASVSEKAGIAAAVAAIIIGVFKGMGILIAIAVIVIIIILISRSRRRKNNGGVNTFGTRSGGFRTGGSGFNGFGNSYRPHGAPPPPSGGFRPNGTPPSGGFRHPGTGGYGGYHSSGSHFSSGRSSSGSFGSSGGSHSSGFKTSGSSFGGRSSGGGFSRSGGGRSGGGGGGRR